jgi:hypothetical protein
MNGMSHEANPESYFAALQDIAFEAIKILEREISGVRDGHGCWELGDSFEAITDNLIEACRQARVAYGLPKDPVPKPYPSSSMDDDAIPF